MIGEKLFYYLEAPNMGGVSLLSFLFSFDPEPVLPPMSLINCVYSFWGSSNPFEINYAFKIFLVDFPLTLTFVEELINT